MFGFEAVAKCKHLRESLALPDGLVPLRVGNLETLAKHGEATRFCRYSMEKLLLPPAQMPGPTLREHIVREMKSLRSKIGKEFKGVPRCVLKACHKVLWDN